MRKYRYMPAIVTFLAGFIVSVIMIYEKYTLISFLWILISVMAAFYFASIIIRLLIINFEKKKEEKDSNNNSENESEEGNIKGEQDKDDKAV